MYLRLDALARLDVDHCEEDGHHDNHEDAASVEHGVTRDDA